MAVDEGREDWLTARGQGLGGTDAAAISNASPFSDPITVWRGKTGQISFERPPTEAMQWGLELEGVIAKRFVQTTGTRSLLRGMDIAPLFPKRAQSWGDHCIISHPRIRTAIASMGRASAIWEPALAYVGDSSPRLSAERSSALAPYPALPFF